MRKICTIIFLSFISHIMCAQKSQDSIAGRYFLQGVMEMASVLELNADSTFNFFYSYGAVDRYGNGKWSVTGSKIILNSRQRPPLDFKMIESKANTDNSITIQILDNNKALLHYVYCIISTISGQHDADANSEGIISFPKEPIDSISLLFRLCPDRYSTFKVDKNLNFFQFRFERWLPEIFFDQIQMKYEENLLIGQHPLLKGNTYRFSKE